MRYLIMSNIIASYIEENKLFSAIVCNYLGHTRGVIKIVFQFKFSLIWSLFKRKVKKGNLRWNPESAGVESRIQHLLCRYGVSLLVFNSTSHSFAAVTRVRSS